MDIKKNLLVDRSKEHFELLAEKISADQNSFSELIDLVFSDNSLISQRAAWVMSKCADRNSNLLLPHLDKLINGLSKTQEDGVKRNILRVLQDIQIPLKYHGILADQCFKFLESKKEAIAIKVFGMTVLANICNEVPELKNELKLIIEDQLPYSSAGFKSRAKKILLRL